MSERVVIQLPLTVNTVSKVMLAIADVFPEAVVVDPTATEKQHGDVLVIEVKT